MERLIALPKVRVTGSSSCPVLAPARPAGDRIVIRRNIRTHTRTWPKQTKGYSNDRLQSFLPLLVREEQFGSDKPIEEPEAPERAFSEPALDQHEAILRVLVS